jgi:hypothetical protein
MTLLAYHQCYTKAKGCCDFTVVFLHKECRHIINVLPVLYTFFQLPIMRSVKCQLLPEWKASLTNFFYAVCLSVKLSWTKSDNLFPFGIVTFYAQWHIKTILFKDVL